MTGTTARPAPAPLWPRAAIFAALVILLVACPAWGSDATRASFGASPAGHHSWTAIQPHTPSRKTIAAR